MDDAERRLDMLLELRSSLIRKLGEDSELVPREVDLGNIALTNPRDESALPAMLQNRKAIEENAAAIFETLARSGRSVADAAAAETPAPTPTSTPEPAVPPASAVPPAPSAATAPPTPPAPPASGAVMAERPTAPGLDFAATPAENLRDRPPGRTVSVGVDESGHPWYAWNSMPSDAGTVVYRVVSADGQTPIRPEEAFAVATTTDANAVDRRVGSTDQRCVQVWAYAGADETQARTAVPVLIAETTFVMPVSGCRVGQGGGSVTGSWTAAPGTTRVMVCRYEWQEGVTIASDVNPQFQICRDSDNLTGFVDRDAVPGKTYEYRVFAWHTDAQGTATFSAAVKARLAVTAPLEPVIDLRAEIMPPASGVPGEFVTLTWTPPPSGSVVIFRAETTPAAGYDREPIPQGALQTEVRLSPEMAMQHPVTANGAARQLVGVPWPGETARLHFTPVSMQDGQAYVGRTVTLSRTKPLTDLQLFQRVEWQLLTFSWPDGAGQVEVYVSPPGQPFTSGGGVPVAVIDNKTYLSDGGLRLRGVLPADGCAVHAVPVSWYGGTQFRGQPASVEYVGLTRVFYRLLGEVDGPDALARMKVAVRRRRSARTLELWMDRQPGPVRFTLVNNPRRLPISIDDGTVVFTVGSGVAPGAWAQLKEFDVGDLVGYVRLFADASSVPGADVAVLDPALDTLRR